jgi:hypothetical protein
LASSFVESGTGDRAEEKILIHQAVSQYTPSRYDPIELLNLFSQIISLDISQRSIFVLPAAFLTSFFQMDGHFLFPWHFVPTGSSNPETPCATRDWRLWWGLSGMDMNYCLLT